MRFIDRLYPGKVGVYTDYPDLFAHLDIPVERHGIPKYGQKFLDPFGAPGAGMIFPYTNPVDQASLCSINLQLPVADRQIKLPRRAALQSEDHPKSVVVHAGRNDSIDQNTFDQKWWEDLCIGLQLDGYRVILVGKDSGSTGYVPMTAGFDLDLRDKTSLFELINICVNASHVVTNDSSVLHLASAGKAMIAYFAVWKHPDLIAHFREGQWSHNMRNFSNGCVGYITDPNQPKYTREYMSQFLPNPVLAAEDIGDWFSQG